GMDTYARGLKAAAKIKETRFLDELKEKRYASYETGIGSDIISGKADLETLTTYALEHDEIKNESTHIEYVKSKLNDYLI
ncbi:xylose isomerase, partial [Carnobacterium sp. ISL-102]|nr:xylose isomerase [Carnobacterium sp. ISL-102]